jgi:hypothetical protein
VRTKITIDGREYSSPEEMPPDVRSVYELAMKHVPALEASGQGAPPSHGKTPVSITTAVQTDIVVNGQSYSRLEDVPVEMRAAVERALKGREAHPRGAVGFSVERHSMGPGSIEPTAFVTLGPRAMVIALAVLVAAALAGWLVFRG